MTGPAQARTAGLVWHYTTGQAARGIVRDGTINPAVDLVPVRELPAVWFSRRQTWEPTASKGIFDALIGATRFATFAEMEARCGGMFRFGMAPNTLLNWPRLVVATRMSRKMAHLLERSGRKAGAEPSDWMGRVGPVSLLELSSLQRLVNGQWISDVSELNGCIGHSDDLNRVVRC